MLYLTKVVDERLQLKKQFLILLPLSRENISSYISPILGLYSIKTKDFLQDFIEQFNKQTNNQYSIDFGKFTQEKISFLSYINIIIPVNIIITDMEKSKYTLVILYPSFWSLLKFYSLNRNLINKRWHFLVFRSKWFNLLFLYRSFQFTFVTQLRFEETSVFFSYSFLQFLFYKEFRHLLLLRSRSKFWNRWRRKRKLVDFATHYR